MKKHLSTLWVTIVFVIIIMVGGCEQEPLPIESVHCEGCTNPGNGMIGGTIGQPPDISYFSPKQGVAGSKVAINGSRFSTTPANNIVKFKDIQATVVSATSVKLVVSVPCGAISGKISVSVGGLTDVSEDDFSVKPHTINSFSPKRGIIGTKVIIQGAGFCETPSANIVTFDGVPAPVISATINELVVYVPASATSGKISVTSSGLQVFSSTGFQIIDIPTKGLVAFYPFDGNAHDIGANQLHGVVNGAALASDRSGNLNSAYFFDGLSDNINVGNPWALQILNSMTLGVWIKTSGNHIVESIIEKRALNFTTGYYMPSLSLPVE